MAEIQSLIATPRDQAGKGSARSARRDGQVPAIVYGNNLEPLMISIERRSLEQEIQKAGFFIRLVDLRVNGETHRVLPRDVQFHPVSDVPLHVDFLRFSEGRRITVSIPVAFENEEDSPGLKRGGTLNVVRFDIEVECTADNIPQSFTADLAGLDIGDSIHASSLALPEGVKFVIDDRDFTIATIAAPTVVAEQAAEDQEAEAEAPAEGAAPEEAPAEKKEDQE